MFDISSEDLINIANESITSEDDKIKSKFAIIIATAKRARQLISLEDPRILGENADNPLTVAINEFKNKSVTIVGNNEN